MSPIDTRLSSELFPVFLNERWEPRLRAGGVAEP